MYSKSGLNFFYAFHHKLAFTDKPLGWVLSHTQDFTHNNLPFLNNQTK